MDVERCYELKKEVLFKFRLSHNYTDYFNLDKSTKRFIATTDLPVPGPPSTINTRFLSSI